MKTTNIFTFLLLAILLLAQGACKDDPEALQTFTIDSKDLNKEVDKDACNLFVPISTTFGQSEWSVEYTEQWITVFKANDGINIAVEANGSDAQRTATIKITSPINSYQIVITQYAGNDVVVSEDIQIKPYGGKAPCQPGYDISKSFDDEFTDYPASESHYHSPWNNTVFPVTMDYYFRGDQEIDYLIYYTRNGNGNFGQLDIYTSTDPDRAENSFVLQGSYDFQMQSAPSRVTFKESVKATCVRFVVKSGLGNFASCDEMHFFQYNRDNTLEEKLLKVFTDVTCSALKDGVTDADIEGLPSDYFVRIAKALKENTYDEWEKDFRIREYKAYSVPEEWAAKLMTKKYTNLDNPTGIAVKEGDEIIVLVGETHGQNISLQCIWEETTTDGSNSYVQTAASGDSYFLKEGVNKLTMKGEGQLFVMYNTDISSPEAQPIKIHIPLGSGQVTGFFDLEEHKTDEKYAELLGKATHKYFCVRGERLMFYFHRTKMPSTILDALSLWTDIISWQQELMGIEDVQPSKMNNHIFAISPEGSYMWASDYRIAFVYTKLSDLMSRQAVMSAKDNAWGPAHEIGHVHQLAIDWPGCTESSNNLFANYVIYKLGKYGSRGDVLSSLAKNRFVKKQPWVTLGEATHQNEDTEIHMRMYWQLWNYYHRLNHNPRFWQTLFGLMREANASTSDPGRKQMIFAQKACEAANQDLTEFFEMWGFFEPVSIQISQYGDYQYTVTPAMIEETRAFMKKFPSKPQPFCYLEDRKKDDFDIGGYQVGDVGHWEQFKANKPITKKPAYTQSGRSISISNGEEAVAFEFRKDKADGEIVYFSTSLNFDVPSEITLSNCKLYAVQADGKRIEMNKQ